MAVVAGGRRAVTHYRVLGRYSGCTHAQCRLETGRTHQIRVHMAYTGHPPCWGDTVYGGRAVKGLAYQCLHARLLTFVHPHRAARHRGVPAARLVYRRTEQIGKGPNAMTKTTEPYPRLFSPIEIKPGFTLKKPHLHAPPSRADSPRTAASTAVSPNTTGPGQRRRGPTDHRGLPVRVHRGQAQRDAAGRGGGHPHVAGLQ